MPLSHREAGPAILIPLIFLTILFGVWPAPLLDVTTASVDNLITQYQAAIEAAGMADTQTAALAN